MDADDLALFDRSVRAAVGDHDGTDLDRALVGLGWADALADDPEAAVRTLFTALGHSAKTCSALGLVMGDAAGLADADGVPIVLPALGGTEPPGHVAAGMLAVRGVVLGGVDGATELVVPGVVDGEVRRLVVDAGALDVTVAAGVDPWLAATVVSGEVAVPAGDAPLDWPAAVARAQLAVAHELLGASRRMLDLAREHALERIQFGQPIARFQAVRHRLADTLVGIETAEAVVTTAWEDGAGETAAIAKSAAGRSARLAAKHCQQVLAGIGFTTEHDLHRYVRRVLVLDQLVGSTQTLTRRLGADVLSSGRLPELLPL